jgi:hypothetical protein
MVRCRPSPLFDELEKFAVRYQNEFKRMDIFRCRHQSHEHFEYKVSAIHILDRKECFPNGCVYYRWRCKLFEKGKPCIRGYHHVGRLCFGCPHFLEEKVSNVPELRLAKEEYEKWIERYQDFAAWVEKKQNREAQILGVISGVKPRFQRFIYPKQDHLRLRGFQISFSEAFIDMDHLDDDCYAVVSGEFQDRWQLVPGTKMEFRAKLTMNRGRIVFNKVHHVEIVERGSASTSSAADVWALRGSAESAEAEPVEAQPAEWTSSKALVARSVATGFDWQPAKCLKCKHSVLADVEDHRQSHVVERRQLFCLQGVPHPDVCPLVPGKSIGEDECQK